MSQWRDSDNLMRDARFWTRIMREHALFIKIGLPEDQTELRERANYFIERFRSLEERLNADPVLEAPLRNELSATVGEFIAYKRRLLRMLVQCQLRVPLYPLLIDHIMREAVRFKHLLDCQSQSGSFQFVMEQEVFWLRIMKEHVEFIIHLLDPSERTLLATAHEFRRTFARLLETARDLLSMTESDPRRFNTLNRFTNEVREQTRLLRDFKAVAHELTVLCRLLSIIPDPLLVDHVRREADKFLQELQELEAILQHRTG
ncbi:MAG TPA: DUF2935 domain-containing protein [Firmicutes bacterium]|jgi:hypothetical protein|nr:DUF2935 domain-containing protein [Bacillota bacterium]